MDTATIERREFKYLLTPEKVLRLKEAIRPFCVLDRFAAASSSQRYAIDSLYLDSSSLGFYFANEHEAFQRFKMRVRRYPSANSDSVFLEIKQRTGDVIEKTRGQLRAAEWRALLEGSSREIPERLTAKERLPVERFVALAHRHRVRPVTQVRYLREPYVSVVDDYVRITFDTEIQGNVVDAFAFADLTTNGRFLDYSLENLTPESLTLLELKFTTLIPTWLVNIVRRLELERQSFSKYIRSVRATRTTPSFRSLRGEGYRL